jgi:drug/metabolite transporter (DMT)-like permease
MNGAAIAERLVVDGDAHCSHRGRAPVTLNVGVGLALVCAALTQLGFLCKHRGANAVPAIELLQPLRSARALLRSPWFAIGMAVTAGAWLMHVAALAVAPLSMVQAVLSTGVVMLAVLGACLFGCKVSSREWLGVGMTAAGLVLLVLTLPPQHGSHASYAWPALAVFEAGMLAVGALLIAAPRLGAPSQHHGAVLGAAAGTLFGVSDVAVKALTGLASEGPLAIASSPWVAVVGCAAVLAFLASARGFQQGDAVPVIACMSTAANVTCIVGGIAVFGDALASQALLFVVQLAAFALVAAAALVTPAGHGRRPVAATA